MTGRSAGSDFHRPVLIAAPKRIAGRRSLPALHVRPPWEAPCASGDGAVREIVIDPGQAFGTGAHATTRLCLELLLELAAQTPRERAVRCSTSAPARACSRSPPRARIRACARPRQRARERSPRRARTRPSTTSRSRCGASTCAPRRCRGSAPPAIGRAASWSSLANLLRPLLLELASAAPARRPS